MIVRSLRILSCIAALSFSLLSQAQTQTQIDDLKKQIDALAESNQAILKELQEIHRALERQQAGATAAVESLDISKEPFRGAAGAKVAIVEFSDYQCPFCGRFQREQYPQILRDYIDTGKVKFVWRDLPASSHAYAEKAAEAAICAGAQGKFWQMHDRMFANQKSIAAADLVNHADAIQLDVEQFQTCLNSGKSAGEIKADVAEANRIGLSGTPAFLIGVVQPNGSVKITKKIIGAKPYSVFKAAIDDAIAR